MADFLFKNDTVDLNNIPSIYELDWKSINYRYFYLVVIDYLIGLIPLVFGAIIAFNEIENFKWYYGLGMGIIFTFYILRAWWAYYVVRSKQYAIREQDIHYKAGVLKMEWTIVPIKKIQTVQYAQSFFAKQLKLANVQISTTDEAGDITIPGIDEIEAKKLFKFLNDNIQGRLENGN